MGEIIDLAAVRARKRQQREPTPAVFRVFVSDGAVCFETPDGQWWQCDGIEAARAIGQNFVRLACDVERAERRARGECPLCGARCWCPKPRFKVHLERGGLAACGARGKRLKFGVPLQEITCARCRALLPRLMP